MWHGALGMAKGKGTSSWGSQNAGAVGEHLRKSLVFIQPKQSETAGGVGANMPGISAFEMRSPACSLRITEEIQIWWRKESLQGDAAHRPQRAGEVRILWLRKDDWLEENKPEAEEIEREEKYQCGISTKNIKIVNKNSMLTGKKSHKGRGGGGSERLKKTTEKSRKEKATLKSQHFIYFRFMHFYIHLLKASFLLNYQSFLQDVTSSFSSRLPFSISFFFAFSQTDRSVH